MTISTELLIGDSEENFYQLGLIDRGEGNLALEQIQNFLGANQLVKAPFLGLLDTFSKSYLRKNFKFKKSFLAYAEALEIPAYKLQSSYLIPEIMSTMDVGHYLNLGKMLGCSSVIYKIQDTAHHFRILDFPLYGHFNQHQRALKMQLKGFTSNLSFGCKGLCYPALSVLTASFSLSLHHKFSSKLNLNGTPIFNLIFELINQCETPKDVIQFVKKNKPLTRWGLVFLFANQKALHIDLDADNLQVSEVESFPYIVTNQSICPEQLPFNPIGLEHYCQARVKAWKKILSKKNNSSSKLMQNLLRYKEDEQTVSPHTITSVGVYNFTPQNHSAQALHTRNFDEYSRYSEWGLHSDQEKTGKFKSIKKHVSFQQLALCQKALDEQDLHMAFHHIQMALQELATHPHHDIYQFFYFYMEFLYIHNKDEKNILLEKIVQHKLQLPHHLAQHYILLELRLLSQLKVSISKEKLAQLDDTFRDLYKWELKLPSILLAQMYKTISIRLDIFDIILPYYTR
jgi:hypothetical protein